MAALLHGTPAAGVNQTLQRGTRNGILLCICVCFCLLLHYNANKGLYIITELSLRAPPIFGWTAITLGIGPHSSYYFYYHQYYYGHPME